MIRVWSEESETYTEHPIEILAELVHPDAAVAWDRDVDSDRVRAKPRLYIIGDEREVRVYLHDNSRAGDSILLRWDSEVLRWQLEVGPWFAR